MSAAQPAAVKPLPLRRTQQDRRRNKRIDLSIDGRFLSKDGEDHTMRTLNLSCSGALVAAAVKPEPGANIVCYFNDLGRVASSVIRQTRDGFAVQFTVSQHKRDKLADRLTWLFNKETLELSDERATPRYVTDGPAVIELADGRKLQCRVVDISLSGASFEADGAAPYIGEIIKAGNLDGEVVRRGRNSFAIRFKR